VDASIGAGVGVEVEIATTFFFDISLGLLGFEAEGCEYATRIVIAIKAKRAAIITAVDINKE
jgi:hypothetical protein